MKLYIYDNRHIQHQVIDIEKNGYIVLENEFSKFIWKKYFEYNKLDEIESTISYVKLEKFLSKEFKMNFDAVVGNFPYEKKVGPGKTEPIWHKLAEKAISLLKPNGIFSVIHPSSWRTSVGKYTFLKDIYLSKKVTSLVLNDFKKGQKVFGAGTNFDEVTLVNTPYELGHKTKITDVKENTNYMDLGNVPFLPNSDFEKILSLVAKDNESRVDILYERSSYGTDKTHMSSEKNDTYKYPCVYTITKRDGVNLWYSSTNDNGLFGVPKVMWSNGLGTYPVVDKKGEYGITQFSYGIQDDVDNLDNIEKALKSKSFLELMESVKFTNNIYDYKIISTFRKDFWKEFLDD